MQSVDGMVDDVVRSAARFTAAAAALTDTGLRAPSGLARWTRAHVLAHVAVSADAYVRLLRSARTDHRSPRRPADAAVLAHAAEEGATLPAASLVRQLNDGLERFTHEARTMSTDAWDGMVTALAGWRHPAWYTLRRCLRELETHHLDLDVGYRTADWPAGYVTWALAETFAALQAQGFPLARVKATDLGRTWDIAGDGPTVAAPGHVLLGWFSGRASADGLASDLPPTALPTPPTWQQPPVPGWGRDY
ncbi:maleylpyruvate isomerase family mycothiol-dependent enzyme [Catellatospora chokoriensis]|uniref:Maleylpyruvate isomerase n=1 Tax=Catellatospora chokoriensis TaxID=310353 RepID=A0A8J3JVS5_9ACTN|nr:maleylpyruvate isomerase family mycothiol-dependent enzyme [Catellatospora chokoriensis]GIF92012.1 maleylpyruvate isomerase [Catellatospora chokoriensis]